MATVRQWRKVLAGSGKALEPPLEDPARQVVVLDTEMGGENSGDRIIMQACGGVVRDLFGDIPLPHVATHYYDPELERIGGAIKLLCGTNILYTHMADQRQWALPHDLANMRDVCLLGVGMSDIGVDDQMDSYTKWFYKSALSSTFLHSVRDEMTRQRLLDIGIDNVLNTACPTMWSLTPELLSRVPKRKARHVLTSITDYCFSPDEDLAMLRILQQEYEKVTIWLQGSHDLDWCLDKIVGRGEFEMIGPDLEDLDKALRDPDLDYVGTRLHAGIRSLTRGHRTLVIAIDNRARQIGADTNLPTLERGLVDTGALERWINSPEPVELSMPWDEIGAWKEQFRPKSRVAAGAAL